MLAYKRQVNNTGIACLVIHRAAASLAERIGVTASWVSLVEATLQADHMGLAGEAAA